jgi:hypothetical protein
MKMVVPYPCSSIIQVSIYCHLLISSSLPSLQGPIDEIFSKFVFAFIIYHDISQINNILYGLTNQIKLRPRIHLVKQFNSSY